MTTCIKCKSTKTKMHTELVAYYNCNAEVHTWVCNDCGAAWSNDDEKVRQAGNLEERTKIFNKLLKIMKNQNDRECLSEIYDMIITVEIDANDIIKEE